MKTLWSVVAICLFMSEAMAQADMSDHRYRVIAGQNEFLVEIADTHEKYHVGLMNRRTMPVTHGLLMIFDQDRLAPIWMKNMQFSLDVVWLSASGEVVDFKTLPVCRGDPCPRYYANQLARFVLELGAGLFPLNLGDKVEIIDASGDSLLPPVGSELDLNDRNDEN